ncbi:unnamed protein product [Thelazia callipaeda]|uniref:Protein kinase domain-containing protein n=1 Tax=Thelazia callipaeda TaxID=103827 RepID=A0A0N5CM36_THECL|nr:unnamed protein product [Thelazia callipaeda]
MLKGCYLQSSKKKPVLSPYCSKSISNKVPSRKICAILTNIMFYNESIFDNLYRGLFSCFKPIWTYFATYFGLRRTKESIACKNDEWEIPFESITHLEWLGSGSQGAVFIGSFNGRLVAVKKVKDKSETELKHLQHINHANLIKFIGVCTQSPCYCIVMEYCGQGQLYEVIRSGRHIEKNQFAQWTHEIADGMNYLHQKRIIHRDLKSPNILVDDTDTLKICDFGTSHQWNRQKSTIMSFCGTAAWMAPEIIKKEPCSEKVDIWSFGVVLWELLTQEIPYKDIDSMAIIWGVGSNNLSLPIPETAPEGMKLLLKQCWSMKPRNRPSFLHILTHIAVFKSEIASITEQEWTQKKLLYMKSIRHENQMTSKQNDVLNMEKFTERALLRMRREELKHAQDIREMYEDKLRTADKIYSKLKQCLNDLATREEVFFFEHLKIFTFILIMNLANLKKFIKFQLYSCFQKVSNNFYRNVEGRWSDRRLTAQRRRIKNDFGNFHRESLQRALLNRLLITFFSITESSLERTLELSALHSDGLCDQERQVRADKDDIKSHHKTSAGRSLLNFRY